MENRPEAWLRGPLLDIPPQLQPVAHALQQAREDVDRLTASLDTSTTWRRIGDAASIGFHLRHMTGSLDRLFTYARGEQLDAVQRAALAAEKEAAPDVAPAILLRDFQEAMDRAFAQLRDTSTDVLDEARAVGRAGLPSTVRGLLYHAGEHTARHAGQISTTVKVLQCS
jgi:uncharacterized damage-inducible protein DinB